MNKYVRCWILWLLCSLAPPAFAGDPLVIQADSCFVNMAPRGGVYPVLVSLHNAGPSAEGVLLLKNPLFSSSQHAYTYPVSLPTGTSKQIVVYPAVNSYGGKITLSFNGSARAKDVDLNLPYREGSQIGLIGDDFGALAALRVSLPASPPKTHSQMPPVAHLNDCYAHPEDAPDRAAGYQGLSRLVLESGAERLRPEQSDPSPVSAPESEARIPEPVPTPSGPPAPRADPLSTTQRLLDIKRGQQKK